ncbi:hypothetical protein FDC28_09000 [Clostridium botulinum]|nr:hypothetical protein [Clostridium botulinum]NFP15198.1 hypothetical protein [Clostridium botulinum]
MECFFSFVLKVNHFFIAFIIRRIEHIMVISIPIKDKIIINRDDQEIKNIVMVFKLVGSKRVNIEPKLP